MHPLYAGLASFDDATMVCKFCPMHSLCDEAGTITGCQPGYYYDRELMMCTDVILFPMCLAAKEKQDSFGEYECELCSGPEIEGDINTAWRLHEGQCFYGCEFGFRMVKIDAPENALSMEMRA